jgi:GDPmannose 4,6-dehydratase
MRKGKASAQGRPVALITGITGQDGTYLAEGLVARGFTVHGLVRSSSAVPLSLAGAANINLHTCDITDADGVRRAVTACAPDQVFHLAGLSSVWRSWEDPALAARVNGLSIACLLEACLHYQDASGQRLRFVNASSAEIFAGSETWPQTEETSIQPTSPYGASKAFSHQLVQIYRARGIHGSNAILYSHESPRRSETFVTRKITLAAARIAIHGAGKLTLGSLEVKRDWGWAPDYVRAMTLMAGSSVADDFIVATGKGHSVRDFAELAFEAAQVDGWEDFLVTDPALSRVGDAKVLVGDWSKAAKQLGWAPTLDLREIVTKMVEKDLELITRGARAGSSDRVRAPWGA